MFVNPDIVLHTYHRFFEMTLEQLEQNELAKSLGDFLTSLHGNLLSASQHSTGNIKLRYQNLLAQITVARVLFENKKSCPSRIRLIHRMQKALTTKKTKQLTVTTMPKQF